MEVPAVSGDGGTEWWRVGAEGISLGILLSLPPAHRGPEAYFLEGLRPPERACPQRQPEDVWAELGRLLDTEVLNDRFYIGKGV